MTRKEKITLIAFAATEHFYTGDCKGLYRKDIIKPTKMTPDEMTKFLSINSRTINQVSKNLFTKIEEWVERILSPNGI